MLHLPDYHTTEQTLHVQCECPRAYFIPFACEKSALRQNRDESPFFKNLCGVWNFRYYPSVHDVCDRNGQARRADELADGDRPRL